MESTNIHELHAHAMSLFTLDDLAELHLRIAFADITDYVSFKGNTVTLKDSATLDPQLVQEVSAGPNGVHIKLADRHKSLEFLEWYLILREADGETRKELIQRLWDTRNAVSTATQP